MLPRGARSFEVTVNLAIGKEEAHCSRNKVYAEDRAHPSSTWETGQPARYQVCLIYAMPWERTMETMTKFEVRNNMVCKSNAIWSPMSRTMGTTSTTADHQEKAARDPKMTTYLNQGVKAKMRETTPSDTCSVICSDTSRDQAQALEALGHGRCLLCTDKGEESAWTNCISWSHLWEQEWREPCPMALKQTRSDSQVHLWSRTYCLKRNSPARTEHCHCGGWDDQPILWDRSVKRQCSLSTHDPEWFRNGLENSTHQCEGTVDASSGPQRHQVHLPVHRRNGSRPSHQRPWSQSLTTDSRRPQTHRRLVCPGLAQMWLLSMSIRELLVVHAKHF